jgi:hypothetical protein
MYRPPLRGAALHHKRRLSDVLSVRSGVVVLHADALSDRRRMHPVVRGGLRLPGILRGESLLRHAGNVPVSAGLGACATTTGSTAS